MMACGVALSLLISSTAFAWKVGTVITPDAGDNNHVDEPMVLYEGDAQLLSGTVFKMWWTSNWGNPEINYAESTDGIAWTHYGSNPILSGGFGRNFVVKNGADYWMYVDVGGDIDLYTSSDGLTFALDTANVVAIGAGGQWDDGQVAQPTVLVESATDWKMLYTAKRVGGSIWSTGLATSTDGRSWTKYGSNPVMGAETTTVGTGGTVVKVGSTYWALPHACASACNTPTDLYWYTSTNFTDWSRSPASAVWVRTGPDENDGVSSGQIDDSSFVEANGSTYLFYPASSDGLSETGWFRIKLAIFVDQTIADIVGQDLTSLVDVQTRLPLQSSGGVLSVGGSGALATQ